MNICDYLKWRGDLSFDAAPFNEVDNFILSQAVNPDYTGIVSAENRLVPIRKAVDEYFAKYGEKGNNMGAIMPAGSWPLVRQMADTTRFGSISFSGFINRVITDNTEQFAAIVFTLKDDLHYICFRGTDDTMIAWKENFLMSVQDDIPARQDALAYLNWAAGAYPGKLIVGGHSKGGNLAVWAAVNTDPEIQDRILNVYSNDGPGFKEEFYTDEKFLRMADRVHVIMPQYSIVGTFFHQFRKEIIHSNTMGLFAHDGFNWEVLGNHFVAEPALSASSQAFDVAFDDALEKMDEKTRVQFIDDLFDVLTADGSFMTLTDMKKIKPRQVLEMISAFGSNPEMKKLIKNVVVAMFHELADDEVEKELAKAEAKLGK